METIDKGKVKFQNAFEYYDIMYMLYRNVLKSSYSSNSSNYSSIIDYYNCLYELFCFVEPFLEEDELIIRYKYYIYKLIQDKEVKDLEEIGISNIFINDLKKDFVNKEYEFLSDYINLIKKRIEDTQHIKGTELITRCKIIKRMLDDAKRILADRMKNNKLTVPINNFDPSDAIKRGF